MSELPQSDPTPRSVQAAAVPKTLADRLRMQISDDIVRGMLAPGATLDETELAHRFNVSRTPVREALRLLASSGLVESRPHRSAVVARPHKAQLLEMFEALRELEALCAGLAALRITREERAVLGRINETLLAAVRGGDPQRYHEINEAFHGAIYAGSHNAYLARLASETRARIAPFSRAQFRTAGRLSRSQAEHAAILDAIDRSDGVAASAAMRRHIESVYDAYGDYVVGT
jgi:DNA-binding GntR family transcriptional regulator